MFDLGILTLPTIEIILVGALSGLVGTLAVLGRRVFFTESLSHGTFPGAVLGVVIGNLFGMNVTWTLFAGGLIICVPLSWIMHRIARTEGMSPEAAAGIVLTLGFASGYFLLRWFQPLPVRVETFLAGSLLNVNRVDIIGAGVMLALTLLALALWGPQLIFYYFDRIGFRAAGLPGAIAETITLTLICATVVVVIPAIGTILSIALLVAPGAGLIKLVRSTKALLILAPIAGVGIGLLGLWLAVKISLSAGGTIAVIAGLFYVACSLVRSVPCMPWNSQTKAKTTLKSSGTLANAEATPTASIPSA